MRERLKIYLISQKINTGYDTFDSAVVVALNEDAAAKIHPCGLWDFYGGDSSWCDSPDQVNVEFLGYAKHSSIAGLVLASFNAG